MPSTMPGFLLLSGLLMFLVSLFGGGIKFKGVEIPTLSKRNRKILCTLGVVFMVVSFLIYGSGVTPPPLALPLSR
jgi:hypothetical protein